MVREGRERVEGGAHIEELPLFVGEVHVYGSTATVGRSGPGIGQEIRVGRMVPQNPLSLGRPQGVENSQA